MKKEKLKTLPFLLLLFYFGITKLFKDLSFEKKMAMLLPIILISIIIYSIQYKNNPSENKKTKFYIFLFFIIVSTLITWLGYNAIE
jgi:formate hydrogenlyase subunit 3/multisubunit Na+/H+ antiporter MnhD subunit